MDSILKCIIYIIIKNIHMPSIYIYIIYTYYFEGIFWDYFLLSLYIHLQNSILFYIIQTDNHIYKIYNK